MRLPLSWPKGPLPAGCGARMVWPPDAAGDVIPMTPIVRVSAIAGVLALAGCSSSSWAPSFSFLSSGANVSLTIESDPPGADAKTSLGPSCRTPCMIPVPADRSFTVNYSLNGYLPQVVRSARAVPAAIFRSTSRAIPGLATNSRRPNSRPTRSTRSCSRCRRPPRRRKAAAGRRKATAAAVGLPSGLMRRLTLVKRRRLNQRRSEAFRAFSSAGERSLHTGEVVGSIPTTPTISCTASSPGVAHLQQTSG